MEYNEFIENIEALVKEKYENEAEVSLVSVVKNNGLELDGIVVRRNKCNIAPTIYLKDFYIEYLDGVGINDIVQEICDTATESIPDFEFDISIFESYEKIKEHLFVKLINKELNSNLLAKAPYKDFLDLCFVVYCDFSEGHNVFGTTLILNEHVALWNIDAEKVLEDALENTRKERPCCRHDINDIICKNGGGLSSEMGAELPKMMVLTNEKLSYGAICMADTKILDEMCRLYNSDIVIIPSSIHEVIVVPDAGEESEYINCIINEVNQNELQQDEILANHIYRYSASAGYILK